MRKRIMLAITVAISLFFTSIGIPGSQAATANLTYAEFAANANYKELSRAMENFIKEMQSKKYMNMTTTVNGDIGASAVSSSTEIASTAGNNFKYYSSKMDLLSATSDKTQIKEYGLVDGQYFGTIATYAAISWNYAKSTLVRLGKPKAKFFITKNNWLFYSRPDSTQSIFASASNQMSAWTIPSQGADDPKTRFSEVIKTPNPLNALDTDYTFDVKIPYRLGSNSFTYVHAVATISGDSKTYTVKVTAESPYFSLGTLTTSISTVINLAKTPVEAPDLKSALDLQVIADMSTRILLEESAINCAKSISAQAKVIAAKAKKKFSLAHLILATKQTQKQNPDIKYTLIKGGVKLPFKYSKISVNVCMTVDKNSTKIKVC